VVFPSLALLGRLSPLYHSPSGRSQFLLFGSHMREREREREREEMKKRIFW